MISTLVYWISLFDESHRCILNKGSDTLWILISIILTDNKFASSNSFTSEKAPSPLGRTDAGFLQSHLANPLI